MTNERKYFIYKVTDKEGNEENVFFRPNSSNRMTSLLAYRISGYSVIAHVRVNEEDWHNAKLKEFCKEYCELDREEHKLHAQYIQGTYPHSEDCLISTLELIQDRKWVLLKNIHRYVRRMMNRDLDIREEIAIMLNDEYLKAIL